ncbi:MAG: serine/threonine-protein kinase [Polyangiales bacterium]
MLSTGVEAEQPYLVLEYVRGVDLWQLMRWTMRESIVMRPALALYVLDELLNALDAVHTASDTDGTPLNVVHRDVSPSNVLISVYGEVKLGDFGIASSEVRDTLGQAVQGERAKGKLGYLSPEQVKGEDTTQSADLFSAGVIAAELLMGRPLFSGGSELAVLLAIRDAKIHPFVEAMPKLPRGLGELVVHALAANPAERTASANQLRTALRAFQTARPEELAEELGALVQRAMSSLRQGAKHEPLVDELDRITTVDDIEDRHTPLREVEAPITSPPIMHTLEQPSQYKVRLANGTEHGPMSYAQLVEQLTTGKFDATIRVSRNAGAFVALETEPDLKRHLAGSRFTPTTREHQQPDAPDRTIDLAQGGFIRALALSALNKDTGFWLCEFGGVRKEVYLAGGIPKFVTSNLAGELLGEYLVARGVITRGELDMALAVMPRFEGRLGDTLTALGLVEPVRLFQSIGAQVRDKLLDLFMWNGGTAALYLGVDAPESAFPLKIDAWRVIEEGIRRRVEEGHEDWRFEGRAEASLVRAHDIPLVVQRAPLPPDARLLLNTLIKPRTYAELGEMLADMPGRRFRASRAVVLLLHLDAIKWTA